MFPMDLRTDEGLPIFIMLEISQTLQGNYAGKIKCL